MVHKTELSPRQLDVLRGIVAGETNRAIGKRLFFAESTVKNIVTGIFDELGVNTRTQAAVAAVLNGYV